MGRDSELDFPCDLPIKILGRNVPEFRHAVLSIIGEYYSDAGDYTVVERQSREGAYVSLTITVRAASRAQADAVYRALSSHEQILMVL